MPKRAFAVRKEDKKQFSDAAVSIAGREFRVGDELKRGYGVIITSNPREQAALEALPVLEELDVRDAESRAKGGNKAALKDVGKSDGSEGATGAVAFGKSKPDGAESDGSAAGGKE